ncbi:MAG: hypothetical protein PPHEESC_4170 [uncultured Paraburkholderia sp.]|nr:MAG: hypothetical protein PPHEESC_4170 [uncultured Paraburkholderia sp.]CAH2931862.1 MAG: hypothetical protein PPHEMADMSA_3944 [uncultured Paraburkholderia sp.]CAH2933191.1 MAG: hypothetical protein PPHERAN_3951 [uncultured Paraburkholderia sp.]
MTQPNLPQTQAFAADAATATATAGFAAAMLGLRTVAMSLLVDRALSA